MTVYFTAARSSLRVPRSSTSASWLAAAATALSPAKQRSNTAVVAARSSGVSWAAVGRARSMTRQSAQERRAYDSPVR